MTCDFSPEKNNRRKRKTLKWKSGVEKLIYFLELRFSSVFILMAIEMLNFLAALSNEWSEKEVTGLKKFDMFPNFK